MRLDQPLPPQNEFECSRDGKNLTSSPHATVHGAELWGGDVPYEGEGESTMSTCLPQ